MSTSLAVAGLLASYIASETLSLGTEKVFFKDPQVPAAFHNYKICFISDIHHGPFSSVKRLRQMVTRINAFAPDLILYGGDFLQTRGRTRLRLERDYQELTHVLSRLHPSDGSFAVLGNHDYVFNRDFNRQQLKKANITLLDNEGLFVTRADSKIRLDGVGDLWFGHPDFATAHAHTDPSVFTLLLAHQPNFIDSLAPKDGVNFVLAGHTHGSQIKLFNYQPMLPRRIARWEYRVGLVKTPQARMLVSPGVGNEIPYFRFFSPPKIHFIVLKTTQK